MTTVRGDPARPGTARRLRHLPLRLVTVLLACSLAACGAPDAPQEPSGTVRVAAAADLRFALDELVRSHDDPTDGQTRPPEPDISVSYASSGQLVEQIRHGAPFDVLLSADAAYVQALVEDGLASPDDVFGYATGSLALWTPQDRPADAALHAAVATSGLEALAGPELSTLAVANPEHAPYGRAARDALQRAGVLESLADRLVIGENVAQAADMAASGNAEAALVALSVVASGPLQDRGLHTALDGPQHPRLEQAGVVLEAAGDPESAREVRDLLLSDAGQQVLRRHGFTTPPTGGGDHGDGG